MSALDVRDAFRALCDAVEHIASNIPERAGKHARTAVEDAREAIKRDEESQPVTATLSGSAHTTPLPQLEVEPILVDCRNCHGTGRGWGAACDGCHGSGRHRL